MPSAKRSIAVVLRHSLRGLCFVPSPILSTENARTYGETGHNPVEPCSEAPGDRTLLFGHGGHSHRARAGPGSAVTGRLGPVE
jgi:hypothetical protein